jgi:type VI secretion system secreted protein Hcp
MAKADMFLRLTGQKTGAVKGESDVKGHEGEIELLGWSWGMSSSGAMGGAGPAARTALSELRIDKRTDTASTQLMSVMRSNELIKEAVLTVRKAGVNPPVDYFVITILKGRITSFDIGNGAAGNPELNEKLSIAFEQIDITYAAQDDKGGKKAGSTFTAQVNPA